MKKNLIRKMILASVMTVVAFSMTACGGDTNQNDSVASDNEVFEDDEVSVNEDGSVVYGNYQEEGDNYDYDCTYVADHTLTVYADDTCVYDVNYEYDDSSKVSYSYTGTVEEDEYGLIAYVSCSGMERAVMFYIDGNDIMAVEEYNNACAEIAGRYTCDDPYMGTLVVDIEKDGDTVLTIDDKVYTGSTFLYEGNWDMMVNDVDYTESFDWYLYFDDVNYTFEFTEYAQVTLGHLEGSYEMNGDLGLITIDIDGTGNATTSVEIDGQKVEFTGFASVGEYGTNVFFNDKDGVYSLDISIYDVEGEYTYDGYLTKKTTLSVG